MYDTSWEGVLEPWRGSREWGYGALSRVVDGFDAGSYDRGVARVMAWLSWGAYVPFEQRAALHEAMGIEEVFFADVAGTQCGLLRDGATGDRVVVFRGTVGLMPWIYNMGVVPRSWEGEGKVHSGFATAWRTVWGELAPRLAGGGRVFFTGHSLGGALATLSVAMLEGAEGYVFGSPMVGSEVFAAAYPADRSLWRCVLGVDAVSRLPLPVKGVRRFTYRHAGLEVPLTSGVVSRREGALSLTELREAFEGKKPPPMLSDHAVGNYLWALR